MINEKQFLNSEPAPKAPTKEDLQIKKLQLQIEQLEQKKQQQTQKQQKTSYTRGLIAITTIFLAPLVILGGFLIACAKASGGTRTNRRY